MFQFRNAVNNSIYIHVKSKGYNYDSRYRTIWPICPICINISVKPTTMGKTRQSGVTDILSTANAAESQLIPYICLVNTITNIERA